MNFAEKLRRSIELSGSYVCVGLDTDLDKIPAFLRKSPDPIFEFNKAVIDATADNACAYKMNSAFYEADGKRGLEALRKTFDYIPKGIVTILDAKRADIGNTSQQYAKAAFDEIDADSITVNPYLGFDSIEPFLGYENRGIIILCLTSNSGSQDFQKLTLENGSPLYVAVAENIVQWEKKYPGNIGMVVGATHPEELAEIRGIAKNIPFLIPGVGAQAGDLAKTVNAGIGPQKAPAMINSSRGIIYASSDKDFAEASAASCGKLKEQINTALLST